jgi:hypothetical protein
MMIGVAEKPSLRHKHAGDQKGDGEVVNNVHVCPQQLIGRFVSVPAVFLSSERRV